MTLSVGDFVMLFRTAANQRRAVKVSPDWRNNSKRNHVLLPLTASGSRVAVGASLGPHEEDDQVVLGRTSQGGRVAINAHPDITLPACIQDPSEPPDDTTCCAGRKFTSSAVTGSPSSWSAAQVAWASDIISWWEGLGGVYTQGTGAKLNNEQDFREDDIWTLPCDHNEGVDDKCACTDQKCFYTLVTSCAYAAYSETGAFLGWYGLAQLDIASDECDCVIVTCNSCSPALPVKLIVRCSGFSGDFAVFNGDTELTYSPQYAEQNWGCFWSNPPPPDEQDLPHIHLAQNQFPWVWKLSFSVASGSGEAMGEGGHDCTPWNEVWMYSGGGQTPTISILEP